MSIAWDEKLHDGIPVWLSLLVDNRQRVRVAFTSDYDTITAPYKKAVEKIAHEQGIGMRKAGGEFLVQQQLNPNFNHLDEGVALAAILDLAEAEEDLV